MGLNFFVRTALVGQERQQRALADERDVISSTSSMSRDLDVMSFVPSTS